MDCKRRAKKKMGKLDDGTLLFHDAVLVRALVRNDSRFARAVPGCAPHSQRTEQFCTDFGAGDGKKREKNWMVAQHLSCFLLLIILFFFGLWALFALAVQLLLYCGKFHLSNMRTEGRRQDSLHVKGGLVDGKEGMDGGMVCLHCTTSILSPEARQCSAWHCWRPYCLECTRRFS